MELLTKTARLKKVAKQRIEICESCEHFISETSQCDLCSCFMKVKTFWPHSTCPINKWGKDKESTQNG